MIRIELAPETLDDIDRFIDHLARHEIAVAADRAQGFSKPSRFFHAAPSLAAP